MEIISRTPVNLEYVADLLERTPPPHSEVPAPRDFSAWHVTNLLDSAQLILKGECRYHEYEGEPAGIMSMGRIWESVADAFLADYARKQGGFYRPNLVLESDGIVASLDGIMCLPSVSATDMLVTEIKLRFSAGSDIPVKHERQICCYCAMLKTCYIAYLVCRIGSRPPTAEAELVIAHMPHIQVAEIWSSVVKTKQYLESKGISPEGRK